MKKNQYANLAYFKKYIVIITKKKIPILFHRIQNKHKRT